MALTQEKLRKGSSVKSVKPLSTPRLSKPTVSDPNYHRDFEDQGLGRRFLDKLFQHKDKIHQVDAVSGLTETNGSVRLRSIQVAMEMLARGIHENDIILISSRTSSDQTVAVLATLLIGAIVAPLDSEVDFKTFVLTLKPKMAFCDVRTSGQLEVIIRDSPESFSCTIVVFGEHFDRLGFEKFQIQKPDPDFKAVTIKDPRRRIAFIVASQSTSGFPRLVCISHHAMRIQVSYYASKLLKGFEKVLSFFPLSWITQVALTCFCYESAIIKIIPGIFSERAACKLIHDLRIDLALLGSDFATKIVRHPSFQDYDLSFLKLIYVGGTLTTALDITFLRKQFQDTKVLQCYGMTEMSCLITAFNPDDYDKALEKPNSVGKPMPDIRFKIIDFDTRDVMGPDWWGELYIAGPTMMLGYYKDIAGTNAVIEKGYLKTGDVAQYDTDGYLYIHGRASDHIMIHGHRFFPTELEDMIHTHPNVNEVVVLGDRKDVVACVIKKPGCHLAADELMEFIADRMPENKRPTKIKFMDNFPKTSVGKIKRSSIRQTVLGITIVHSKSVVSFEGSP
ncbi:hypothetical protein ILUMI_21414 [Ignelater luminosus]|uniref:Uncharacterized protein n=1 Tax=Ignelater luminosus TaxID=2038154 RepID=A0A8K0FXZ3_IGNLU|nr:hypothetical protein ILUMI_21414 [Ignelater luminosus]